MSSLINRRSLSGIGVALCCFLSAGIYLARSDSPSSYLPFTRPSARPPTIEADSAPYGPYWLSEDFGFYPIPDAIGGNVSLLMSFKYHDKETYPLPEGHAVYCKGEENDEWSLMGLREGVVEPPPHEHINVFACAASGSSMTFKHVTPAGNRYMTIPLCTVRARPQSARPKIVAWTMLNGWTSNIPLWLEYQLAHGIDEIYIYNNEDNFDPDAILATKLAPYISAGLVIIVPWLKIWHGHLLGDWWVSQQIVAVNHAMRSFDGYAEWILFSDIDEFPILGNKDPFEIFSYASILDAELEADPTLASVFMRHVFGRDPVETPRFVDTSLGPIPNFSPRMLRHTTYYDNHDRAKWFTRPSRVPLASIHEPSVWHGTNKVLDPATNMWILHLSDHPERTGDEMDLDLSHIVSELERLLHDRLGDGREEE